MTDIVWAIQDHPGEDCSRLLAACNATGVTTQTFQSRPFSDELPDIPDNGPVVFYGSPRVGQLVHETKKWTPGVIGDPADFDFDVQMAHWGERMLNSGPAVSVQTLGQLQLDSFLSSKLFVRSAKDDKSVAGFVDTVANIRQWSERLIAAAVDPHLQLIVAETRPIEAEYRYFLGQQGCWYGIWGVSQYKRNGQLFVRGGEPEDKEIRVLCRALAGWACATWVPAPVFVLDVAVFDGEAFIVEANGFNGSAFYGCDVENIVRQVNTMVASDA